MNNQFSEFEAFLIRFCCGIALGAFVVIIILIITRIV